MCVLCKFYNQHRFHKYDLMLKVATNYSNSVTESLAKTTGELGERAGRDGSAIVRFSGGD